MGWTREHLVQLIDRAWHTVMYVGKRGQHPSPLVGLSAGSFSRSVFTRYIRIILTMLLAPSSAFPMQTKKPRPAVKGYPA